MLALETFGILYMKEEEDRDCRWRGLTRRRKVEDIEKEIDDEMERRTEGI